MCRASQNDGIDLLPELTHDPGGRSAKAHEMQIAMMEAGLIPNVVDYFDVDTDPKGKFALWI